MYLYSISINIFLFFYSCAALSQELKLQNDILVTAEIVKKSTDKLTSSYQLITRKMIDSSGVYSLGELLGQFASMSTSKTGGLGSSSSTMIRGAASEYTTIIVDGIKLSDGTRGAGGFSMENLNLSNIESIEVIKNSSTMLYGDGAISGVIKVTTRSYARDGTMALLLGSYKTYGLQATVTDAYDKIHWNFNLEYLKSDGISSFNEDNKMGEAESDGYETLALGGKFLYDFSKNNTLEFIFSTKKSETETDGYINYIFSDTKGDYIRFEQDNYGFINQREFLNGQIDSKFIVNYNHIKRYYHSLLETINYKSNELSFKNTNVFYNDENHSLFFGLEYLNQDYTDDQDSKKYERDMGDFFLGSTINNGRLFCDFGFRKGIESNRDSPITFKLGMGYNFTTDTILKINLSNGVKNPTLYQLYSQEYGNNKLLMTKSMSSLITIEQNLNNATIDLSFFENTYRSEISYDFVQKKYFNIGRSDSKGYELNLKFQDVLDIKWDLGYLSVISKDLITGKYLLNRPSVKFHINSTITLSDDLTLFIKSNYTGRRNDYTGAILGGYLVQDLSLFYNLEDSFCFFKKSRITFNLNNIFNRQYIELAGYGTMGRNYQLQLKISFF